MYTNNYDVYDDLKFTYYYPYTFNYLTSNFQPYSSWNYKDTTSIPFPAIDKVSNTQLLLDVFNYRYESIFNAVLDDSYFNEEDILVFNINEEISNNVFKKGIYPFSIVRVSVDDLGNEQRKTILSSNENYFYVK